MNQKEFDKGANDGKQYALSHGVVEAKARRSKLTENRIATNDYLSGYLYGINRAAAIIKKRSEQK